MAETKRQRYEKIISQLIEERSSFIPHWRDLADHIMPRRQRFLISDVNKGDRRNNKIVNNTGTLAARTLRAGMMSGVTSPARPWFRLATPDPDLQEFGPVKEWLHVVGRRMSSAFLRSNLYNILPITYGDMGTFGTAAMSIEEDFQSVSRFNSFPIGSYCIGQDYRGSVNTFSREFKMTVRQVVEQFGQRDKKTGKPIWDNFSTEVRGAWDRSEYERWVDVKHLLLPNEEFDERRLNAKFKKFSSCYFEAGKDMDDKFLRESGYDRFPILAPRWEKTGEDSYGTDCPGMTTLGDIKMLQLMERRGAEALDKKVRPPMTGPSQLRNHTASILAGDITYVDTQQGQQGFRPAHEVNLSIAELMNEKLQVANRIQRGWFEDLFLMLANDTRSNITATEIAERKEEKLLALGPVLEQLNQDVLDPLIDNQFDIMMAQGALPPPPEELQGVKLKVDYISVMAEAQKLIGLGGVERFTQYAGQVAEFDPGILKKIDADQLIDVYGDMVSLPPKIIRTDEQVAAIRAQEAQAAQAQQMAQNIPQLAGAAKDLSQTDMENDSALKALLQPGA